MAHSNGRIYIDANTTGVEIADLQRVLGRGTGDIGLLCGDVEWDRTQTPAELRRAEKINPLAKFKPERINKWGLLALSERQNNFFGLSILPYGVTGGGSITQFLERYTDEWAYLPPRGLSYNEQFRLRDFEDYYHYATCFVNPDDCIFPNSIIVMSGGEGARFRLGIRTGNNLSTGSIGIGTAQNPDGWRLIGGPNDPPFCNLYFGLIFVNGSTVRLITATSPLSADGYGSELLISQTGTELDGITKGTSYAVYPVLSVSSHSSFATLQNDILVSLPLDPFSFVARDQVTAQNIAIVQRSAIFDDSARLTVKFTLEMSANSGASTTISAVQYIVKAATSSGDTTGATLTSGVVNNLSTTNPKSVEWTGRPTKPNWVYIYANNESAPTVFAEGWAKVRTGGIDPIGPEPPTEVV